MKISTQKILLLIILALLLLNLLNRRCSSKVETTEPKVTIVRDTVWQTKIDTFKIQTTQYKTVYVDTSDVTNIIEDTSTVEIPEHYVEAKVYRDTLSNDDIDIFTYSLIKGRLLDSELSYKLKVPREITTTKTIEYPKTYRSGLYAFGEVGGNTSTFDNISFGLQYNRKGKWFASYRINLNSIQQPTHNIGFGVRLFKKTSN